jgi:hypothetical protein
MWNYSEEIVEEEGDADGKGEKKRTPEQGSTSGDKHDRKDEKAEKRAKTRSRRSDRELLSFSIEAPRKPRRTAASIESDDVEVERNGTMVTAQSVGNGTFWAGSTSNTTARQEVDTEPAGKRLRVR